jgi:hypothetical protein
VFEVVGVVARGIDWGLLLELNDVLVIHIELFKNDGLTI